MHLRVPSHQLNFLTVLELRLMRVYSFGSEYIFGAILYHETPLDFQLGSVLSNPWRTRRQMQTVFPSPPSNLGLKVLMAYYRIAGLPHKSGHASINAGLLLTSIEVQAESLTRFAAISQLCRRCGPKAKC